MQVRSFGISHRGLIRDLNEDRFLNCESEGLFLIADGMGGLAKGDVASRIAVETIETFIKKSRREDITWPITYRRQHSMEENRLLAAVSLANWNIYNEMLRSPRSTPMGTTLVGFLVDGDRLILVNVGDSRAYLIRNRQIEQLTEDHSLVMEEVKKGHITPEEARHHPQRHVINRALGIFNKPEMDITTLEIQNQDLYLLCSDGLSDMVLDEEILSLVQSHERQALSELGDALIHLANERGGKDNITVVLVAFNEQD
ncbi:MAG: Stp1/IreP family PP2C-type Ser/Thr phosphatase [Deltaproteobacteria bacterium]